jgi:TIR domain/Jacalin-like lectin domain
VTKIIISYRRADSDVFAGRVRDSIANSFGEESVFIDVDNIPFGKDFRVHIQEAMAEANAVLVVIGPAWLGPGNNGRSRIMDDRDPVRIEVETALNRRVPTVPILVGKTSMPAPEQLPESIRDLAFINAASVDTGRDFHRDLDRVIETISALLRKGVKRRFPPSAKRLPWLRPAVFASVAAAAIIVGLAIAGYFYSQSRTLIVTQSAAFGGDGGAPFDDTKSTLYNHRPISGFNIVVSLSPYDRTQQIIGSIQLLWDDTAGPADGNGGTLPQPVTQVRLQANEKIGRVDVHWGTYHWAQNTPAPQWVAGLSIWTNIQVYNFGDVAFGSTGQCILQNGDTLLGFYGRSGSYIDQLGCVIATTK